MADVYTRIGYIKGATGAQGAQGLQGDPGEAATIEVGSVTTVPYGQTANVTNSGTESAAIFDFQIPQGRPGEQVTDMQNLTIGAITTSSASFPVPAVGETGKVLWGKVVKWFSDMTALVATKLNVANVVNNLTTTASGYALDARQGKTLYDIMADYIRTVEYSVGQVTIAAYGQSDQNIPSGTIPSGYKLLDVAGIAGMSSGGKNLAIGTINFSGNGFRLINTTNSSITTTPTVRVTCVKTF